VNVVWPDIKQIYLIYQHIAKLVCFLHKIYVCFYTYNFIF